MKRTKKIYRYVDRLVRLCLWCEGTGLDQVFTGEKCFTCKGRGGTYKRVKELVGEEVTE